MGTVPCNNYHLITCDSTMFCGQCGCERSNTKFCSQCGYKHPPSTLSTTTDPDVQFLGATTSSLSSFSTRPPSIHTASSRSLITAQVRDAKQKATLQDRASKKDVLPQSKFGLDPQGKNLEPVGEYGRCWVLGTKDQTPTSFCGSSELLRTPTDPTIPTNPTEFFR
jgi:hypothetical protein